jgi:hypothetical protein
MHKEYRVVQVNTELDGGAVDDVSEVRKFLRECHTNGV